MAAQNNTNNPPCHFQVEGCPARGERLEHFLEGESVAAGIDKSIIPAQGAGWTFVKDLYCQELPRIVLFTRLQSQHTTPLPQKIND